MQSCGWEAIVVEDGHGLQRDAICGAESLDGLARCAFYQGAHLAWSEMGDQGAQAGHGIPFPGLVSVMASSPLGPGAGDDEGEDGAED